MSQYGIEGTRSAVGITLSEKCEFSKEKVELSARRGWKLIPLRHQPLESTLC